MLKDRFGGLARCGELVFANDEAHARFFGGGGNGSEPFVVHAEHDRVTAALAFIALHPREVTEDGDLAMARMQFAHALLVAGQIAPAAGIDKKAERNEGV